MAKRSCKGNFAYMSAGLLRLLNVLILGAAIASIAIVFIIKPVPTGEGWALIVVGGLTVLSAIFGVIFGASFGCCGLHLLAALLASAGLCAASIVLLVQPNKVQTSLQPTVSESDAHNLVKAETGIFCLLFVLQVVVLLMMCMLKACDCQDDYMEMEQTAREAAKMQQEDERRRARIEATSAHKLSEKMKEKYGQYGSRRSDFDIETPPQR